MPPKHVSYRVTCLDKSERERIAALAAAVGLSVSNWFRRAAGLPLAEMGGYREHAENTENEDDRTKTPKTPARPAK